MFHLPNPYRWQQPRRATSFRHDLCEGALSLLVFGLVALALVWLLGVGFVTIMLGSIWAISCLWWLMELPGRLEIARTDVRISRLLAQVHPEPVSCIPPPSGSRRRMLPPRARRSEYPPSRPVQCGRLSG